MGDTSSLLDVTCPALAGSDDLRHPLLRNVERRANVRHRHPAPYRLADRGVALPLQLPLSALKLAPPALEVAGSAEHFPLHVDGRSLRVGPQRRLRFRRPDSSTLEFRRPTVCEAEHKSERCENMVHEARAPGVSMLQ